MDRRYLLPIIHNPLAIKDLHFQKDQNLVPRMEPITIRQAACFMELDSVTHDIYSLFDFLNLLIHSSNIHEEPIMCPDMVWHF